MHGQEPDEGRADRGRHPADGYRRAGGPGPDNRSAAADGYRDRGYPAAGGDDRGNDYGDRGNGYRDDSYLDPVGGDGGVYRGRGLYRSERPGYDQARSRPDERRRETEPADGYAEFATGDFDPSAIDNAAAAGGHSWQAPEDRDGRWGDQDGDARGRDDMSDQERKELFGQIVIFTLMEEQVDVFDRLTERVVELVRQREPDTLVFISHAVPSAPTQRILYQVYRSRGAYQRHLAQPYIQQFDLDRRASVLATNVVELGLQQAKVSPFPSVAELFPEPGYDTSGFERPDYLRDYGRNSAPRGGSSREYR
jgi:quinol monooxygenase YgiN